ncbi:MAG: 50S ribosome-binding GTPase [Euryarchaeota archaeon]|nr:50S ribosome-binding GTPase [Euryarchaeota archaeon]
MIRSDPEEPEETLDARAAREAAQPQAGRRYILASIHPDTAETVELAATLGLARLAEVVQTRREPHAGTYFGKGKVEQVRAWVKELAEGRVPAEWVLFGKHWEPAPESAPDEDDWGAPSGSSGETGGVDLSVGGRQRRGPWSAGKGDLEGGSEGTAPGPRKAKERAESETRTGSGVGDPLVSGGSGYLEGSEGGKTSQRRGHGRRATEDAREAPTSYDPDRDPPLLLLLNDEVRPGVLFNLEERLGIEVWDRTRLILEIFSLHANVKEARLQVELAKLQYEVPLVREAVHRKRSGERPGFMGGGEYAVADYQDFIKRRMGAIKKELEHIRKERTVRRQVRREGFYLVSLAGYTNAGKSSLLNAMTGAGTLSRGTLFSTLGTTTRRVLLSTESGSDGKGAGGKENGGNGREVEKTGTADANDLDMGAAPGSSYERPILLTDTVGFIQALPSWLLEAFHSTLEEISVSDVVLLVADVSDQVDVLGDKVEVCRDELAYLDVTCPVILVLNKTDLVPERAVELKKRTLVTAGWHEKDIVPVSSLTGEGMETLRRAIDARLADLVPYEVSLPMDGAGHRLLDRLHRSGRVDSVVYGEKIEVKGACDPLHWRGVLHDSNEIGVQVRRR